MCEGTFRRLVQRKRRKKPAEQEGGSFTLTTYSNGSSNAAGYLESRHSELRNLFFSSSPSGSSIFGMRNFGRLAGAQQGRRE